MWFDETPRLFTVAEMLKKKKNKDDNYERDDIPDVKKQELTGKYDKNFDALGSDFERAHNYTLSNIQQPDNTKPDIEYSDKYKDFLKYEPSTYVKLEEDEYKPFSKNDEKANEYYIDNLQGKTLDDLIISKMKENAGAEDLPRDASRRKFANDLLNQELPSFSSIEFSAPEKELQEQRNRDKKTTLRNLNARMSNVVIEAPLSSQQRDKGEALKKLSLNAQQKRSEKFGDAYHDNRVHSKALDNIKENVVRQEHFKKLEARGKEHHQNKTLRNAFDNLRTQAKRTSKKKEPDDAMKNVTMHRGEPPRKPSKPPGAPKKSQNSKSFVSEWENVQFDHPDEVKEVKDEVKDVLGDIVTKVEEKDQAQKKNSKNPAKSTAKSPANTVVTDVADYMESGGSGGGGYVPVPRGLHPNTSLALQRVAQGKLETRFPKVEEYQNFYSKKDKSDLVQPAIIKKYNDEVKPQIAISSKTPITVETFLESIKKEYNRRKPKTPLTAEALAQLDSTPSKSKSKDNGGHHSPLGHMLGLDV